MSKIALSGHASGTGTLTFAAPNTNTDRTLTLPDSAGTLATSESVAAAGYTTSAGVLSQFNASGSAPVYACRAWVNFNGQGTVAIRASGNVSSITDLGTGYFQYNFTTSMPDANYCVVAHHAQNGNSNPNYSIVGQELFYTTSSFRTNMNGATGGSTDPVYVFAAVFR